MLRHYIICSLMMLVAATAAADDSSRHERNYIREGNKLYKQEHYADAEVQYRKALEVNPSSEVAQYDLALSLLRQAGAADPNNGNNPVAEASSLLQNLSRGAQDPYIAESSFYNLGNIAYNNQQYDQAIQMYKAALRKNPDNDKTRENLRLAQLKKEQQQDQNQDQNQDQQNQDQDQNQDQQNQDQNQDQQDQNQDQDQQQQQQQQDQDQQQQQQQMNNANADNILKAMENQENATRRKVMEQQKEEAAKAASRQRGKQW